MAAQSILVNASFAPSLIGFRGPLLRRMVQAGHRVHVSAPSISTAIADELRAIGVTSHEVPLARTGLSPLQDLRYRAALRRLISVHSIDLVVGYTIKPCIWGSIAARECGVQSASLVTGLGYAFIQRPQLRQRLASAVARRLWRRATAANRVVIFQNPDDCAEFVSTGVLADPGKAKLVNGSGVDMAHYERAPMPKEPHFLMTARLLGHKGVREYGRAVMTLRTEGLAARFSLVGYHDVGPDGIRPEELDQLCQAGLDYMGPREDVRPALRDCSVFVLPSYREGTPRSVLEAMATGRAIITSDAPGCRETIVHEESGLLVSPRDANALADAMRRLANDSALRERFAEAAWQRCLDKFEVERVNDTMFRHLDLA